MSDPRAKGAGMPAASGGARASGSMDVTSLAKDPEQIKILMKRDPRFIARLITDLDKSMHKKMAEKAKRQEEMAAAQKEIEKIDETIRTHITPHMERLEAGLASKRALREHLAGQVAGEMGKVRDLEAEARALISKSRHMAGKLMRTTATQRLEEARGFSAATPTTTLLKAGSPKKPGS